MRTKMVRDLQKGDLIAENRRVYHVSEHAANHRNLLIEKLEEGGTCYSTYLPADLEVTVF